MVDWATAPPLLDPPPPAATLANLTPRSYSFPALCPSANANAMPTLARSVKRPSAASVEADIVRRLVAALHPSALWLFGSRARKTADKDSDFDIAILIDNPAKPCWQLEGDAIDALWGVAAAIDVCVWPTSEFAAQQAAPASLPATILREGRELYRG